MLIFASISNRFVAEDLSFRDFPTLRISV